MKPSRPSLTAFVALAVSASALWLRAEDSLPKAQPVARYESMAARSPFTAPTVALPTPAPAPTPAGPHWWDQMAITSIMEAGGSYFAAVVDHANNKRYVLESGKTDQESQLLLTEVQWSEHSDQTTVTVRRGTEIAPPLKFDTTAVASAPVGPQQPFNMPGKPTAFNVPAPPPNFNSAPPPPPSTAVVRRNPIGSYPPGQPNPATVNQPAATNSAPELRKVRPLGGNGQEDD